MRVLLDTTYARRAPFSGTAVYLDRLAEALSRLDGVEVIEASNRRRRPPSGGGAAGVGNALADRWWGEVELPRRARAAGAEVIHHPLPDHAYRARLPQVVTVHDLAFERLPECFARGYRSFARHWHRAAARSANAVVCVSETTARDVGEYWGVASERLVIAPHGPGQDLPAAQAAAVGAPSHFLYVGDDEPRKNLATLLAGYARYRAAASEPWPLVLAGSAPASAASSGVRLEPHPSPQHLARLYAEAVALVHPALYEGFGMTPLEAMRLGTPVIAARAPGVTEVCGDAARYFDPRDPVDLAAALADLAELTEPGEPAELAELAEPAEPAELGGGGTTRRQRLAAAGRARAERYSWAASARRHLDAYSLARTR